MQKLKIKKSDWYAIPNILGYIRLLLIPLFVWRYLTASSSLEFYTAALIVAISSLTDMLDGKIARKYNAITELGKIIDPVADKFTLCAILVCFTIRYEKAFIILLALFMVKELSMGLLSLVLLNKGKKLDGAKWFGKFATALIDVIVVLLLLFPNISPNVIYIAIFVMGAVMFFAFIMYTYTLLKMLIGLFKTK